MVALPSTSILAVPKVKGDELDSVLPIVLLQPSSDGGVVEVDPSDKAWLANLEPPGYNLLVSGLGEETVQLIHQQDVQTS